MAITALDLPGNNRSVHDDLFVVATSDNANAVDFKFVFDVFANGKQLIRAKIYPNPNTSLGYFDISNVVANEMKFNWFVPNGDVVMCELDNSGQITLPVQIRCGEDVSGITSLNLESGQIYVANIVPNLNNRKINDILYATPNTFINKYNSNRPRIAYTNVNEDFYIGLVADNYGATYEIRIKQYNSSGTLLATNTITLPACTKTGVYQLNISPDAINETIAGSDIFLSSCAYYDVEIWDTTPNPDVKIDSIRMYFKCVTKYEVINLHFLNNKGTFDTARFDLLSRLTMDVERKSFEQPDFKLGNGVTFFDIISTDKFTNYQYYESKVNYGSKYQWSYKLTMDFPTDAD